MGNQATNPQYRGSRGAVTLFINLRIHPSHEEAGPVFMIGCCLNPITSRRMIQPLPRHPLQWSSFVTDELTFMVRQRPGRIPHILSATTNRPDPASGPDVNRFTSLPRSTRPTGRSVGETRRGRGQQKKIEEEEEE